MKRLKQSIKKATHATVIEGMTAQEIHKGPKPETKGGPF